QLIERYNFLLTRVPENIALADKVVNSLDKQSSYYPIMLAHSGLLRRSMLTIIEKNADRVPQEVIRRFDRDTLRREAMKRIETAADLIPDYRDSWKWYFSLCALAQDVEKRR